MDTTVVAMHLLKYENVIRVFTLNVAFHIEHGYASADDYMLVRFYTEVAELMWTSLKIFLLSEV